MRRCGGGKGREGEKLVIRGGKISCLSALLPQAMCSLLEFQDLELTHYSAVYSPTSREKLKSKAKTKRLSILEQTPAEMFSDAEINNCRAEITKVTDRIALLRTHCGDAIEQVSITPTHTVFAGV